MPGGRHKFPKSTERSEDKPAVLCPADRVLNLYNQENDAEAKRISKKVREWFSDTAHAAGWDAVGFLPEVQSQHGAGCVLVKSFNGARAEQLIENLGATPEDKE